jgi:hypothetical protein
MIELQAEQQTFVFEGFPLELGLTVQILPSTRIVRNGDTRITRAGDIRVTRERGKTIVLEARNMTFVFEGWQNG